MNIEHLTLEIHGNSGAGQFVALAAREASRRYSTPSRSERVVGVAFQPGGVLLYLAAYAFDLRTRKKGRAPFSGIRHTARGLPCGTAELVRLLELHIGQRLLLTAGGRPRKPEDRRDFAS